MLALLASCFRCCHGNSRFIKHGFEQKLALCREPIVHLVGTGFALVLLLFGVGKSQWEMLKQVPGIISLAGFLVWELCGVMVSIENRSGSGDYCHYCRSGIHGCSC